MTSTNNSRSHNRASEGKVLISPSSFGECGIEPLEMLRAANIEFLLNPFGRRLTGEEALNIGSGCIGIIAGVEVLNKAILERLPNLRVISRCGSGVDNVDLEAAQRLGVTVCNTPDGPVRAVAEHTLGLILALLRNILITDRSMRQGQWRKEMGQLLRGRKVGILGLGSIGRELARLLITLGCTIISHDVNPPDEWADAHAVRLVEFHELLELSEILCIHISIRADAPLVIGASELSAMQPGSFLVNMARGSAVDELALIEALQNGQLAGAALDVFNQEPYSGPLTKCENAILTPHIGSYARDARLEMEVQAVRNLIDALQYPLADYEEAAREA